MEALLAVSMAFPAVAKAAPVLRLLAASSPVPARAGRSGSPAVATQWVVAEVMESASGDWKPGMGLGYHFEDWGRWCPAIPAAGRSSPRAS